MEEEVTFLEHLEVEVISLIDPLWLNNSGYLINLTLDPLRWNEIAQLPKIYLMSIPIDEFNADTEGGGHIGECNSLIWFKKLWVKHDSIFSGEVFPMVGEVDVLLQIIQDNHKILEECFIVALDEWFKESLQYWHFSDLSYNIGAVKDLNLIDENTYFLRFTLSNVMMDVKMIYFTNSL